MAIQMSPDQFKALNCLEVNFNRFDEIQKRRVSKFYSTNKKITQGLDEMKTLEADDRA